MLRVEELDISFGKMPVIKGLSLELPEAGMLGVFGQGGAGKTSLMHALSGLILEQARRNRVSGGAEVLLSGRILLAGRDVSRLSAPERVGLGLVLCPERRHVFPACTVLENLKAGAHLLNRKQAGQNLAMVRRMLPQLARLEKRLAGMLSGGEQQILAIARALMASPKVLLLDEPLMGLSPGMHLNLRDLVERIREHSGVGILVTEQYARPLLPLIDQGHILDEGVLGPLKSPEDLGNIMQDASAYLGGGGSGV